MQITMCIPVLRFGILSKIILVSTWTISTHKFISTVVELISCDLYSKHSEEPKNDVTCHRESFMEVMDEIEDWLYTSDKQLV